MDEALASQIHVLEGGILPVLSLSDNDGLTHIGTCFIIAALGREALIVSAAHVFNQAQLLDGDRDRHHASALPEFLPKRTLPYKMRSTKLRVIVAQSEGSVHLARVGAVMTHTHTDLALATISFHEEDGVPTSVHFGNRFSIDTTPPPVGTLVQSAGFGDTETRVELLEDGVSSRFISRLDNRSGCVVEHFPDGYAPLKLGPSFQIDSPISSGMSGGPVFRNVAGKAVVCGVNTSDLATTAASATGEASLAQMLWPLRRFFIRGRDNKDEITRNIHFDELLLKGIVRDISGAT